MKDAEVEAVGFYTVCMIAVCIHSYRFGEKPERLGAFVIISASVASSIISLLPGNHFNALESGIFIVDVAALAGFLWLALATNRFWPLWATAFQLIAVTTHLTILVDPTIIPLAYAISEGFWAYPVLAALLLASERCRRERTQTPRRAMRS